MLQVYEEITPQNHNFNCIIYFPMYNLSSFDLLIDFTTFQARVINLIASRQNLKEKKMNLCSGWNLIEMK